MALWLTCIFWLVAVIVALALFLYMYTTYKQTYFKRHGIPQPRPTPMFGMLGKMSSMGFFEMDAQLVRENGTFFGIYMGNSPSLIVADPHMLREILVKEFSAFTDHTESIPIPKLWRKAVNNARGEHWKFLRASISPTFSSGRLKKLNPLFLRCLDDFIDCLKEKLKHNETKTVDMHEAFSALSMDAVCTSSFGIEVNSQKDPNSTIVNYAKRLMNFNLGKVPVFVLAFLFPELKPLFMKLNFEVGDAQAMAYIMKAIKGVIADRKEDPASDHNDMLQTMINLHKEETKESDDDGEKKDFDSYKKQGLSEDEILVNSIIFLLAGFDTTSSAMTWVSCCLALNPESQERLIEEIDREIGTDRPVYENVFKLQYLDMVVSETLRLYSPGTRLTRSAARDVVICGRKIPKGANVQIPVHGIHRLPQFWPDPEKFDPERFSPENKGKIVPYSYLPFGDGPRNCVGMRFALMEVKMAIVTLLQHFRVYTSAKTNVPPKVAKGFLVKPEGGMFLKVEERK